MFSDLVTKTEQPLDFNHLTQNSRMPLDSKPAAARAVARHLPTRELLLPIALDLRFHIFFRL